MDGRGDRRLRREVRASTRRREGGAGRGGGGTGGGGGGGGGGGEVNPKSARGRNMRSMHAHPIHHVAPGRCRRRRSSVVGPFPFSILLLFPFPSLRRRHIAHQPPRGGG